MSNNLPLKLILVGSTSVGKTSIINQYKMRKFFQSNVSTVGVDLSIDKNVIIEGRTFDIAIWDTAGQERFKSIVKLACRDSDVALLCFDLNEPQSLSTVPGWIEFLKQNCPTHLQIIIVGTKKDMQLMYSKEQLENALNSLKNQFNEQFEIYTTSSKTGEGLKEVFYHAYEKASEAKYGLDQEIHNRDALKQNTTSKQSFKLSNVRKTENIVSPNETMQENQASHMQDPDPKKGCC